MSGAGTEDRSSVLRAAHSLPASSVSRKRISPPSSSAMGIPSRYSTRLRFLRQEAKGRPDAALAVRIGLVFRTHDSFRGAWEPLPTRGLRPLVFVERVSEQYPRAHQSDSQSLLDQAAVDQLWSPQLILLYRPVTWRWTKKSPCNRRGSEVAGPLKTIQSRHVTRRMLVSRCPVRLLRSLRRPT